MQRIIWDRIEIDINYVESYSPAHERIYADKMSHIELYSNDILPITDTGYKSIFILKSNLDRWGGVEKYIMSELDFASNTEEWKRHIENRNQLSLF